MKEVLWFVGRVIGIDLGTTNTVVATIEDGRPVVIKNQEGNSLTPSIVTFLPGGGQLVGWTAKRQAVANASKTVASVKRRMGICSSMEVGEQICTPQEISSHILRKVKLDAESYLGECMEKAVVTVPAYFNDNQRKATKEACRLAGLDVVRLINEPTAAALAYGLDRQDIHKVLVWDLGGGTFDVSILELGEGVFEVKAVSGNTSLGGDDWTQRIVDYLTSTLQDEQVATLRHNEVMMQELIEVAEKAKIELSTAMTTVARLSFLINKEKDAFLDIPLTRLMFDDLTSDLRQGMVIPTQQALQDAGLKPDDIDRVLLVGGSTRMPAIKQLAREVLGKEPYAHINPDEVVAIGAAIQAGILSGQIKDVVLVDVTPLSLGIETQGGVFAKIIDRNTTIPCSRSRIFTTAKDNQTTMDIHVLQGERAMAKDNISLGMFQFEGVPMAARGEPRVEVVFRIDTNSMVQVTARDLYTGSECELEIVSPFRFSESEIKQIIAEAQGCAVQDGEQRDMVELRVRADNLLVAVNQLIKSDGKDIDDSLFEDIKRAVLKVELALASDGYEIMLSATEELEGLARSPLKESNLK